VRQVRARKEGPAEDRIHEHLHAADILKAAGEVPWWGVMPLDGGLVMVPEPMLEIPRPAAHSHPVGLGEFVVLEELTVSLLDVPPFECLTQDTAPYSGFGPPIAAADVSESFSRVVEEATHRITEMFGVSPQPDRTGIVVLEELVSRMWREGWDPATSDTNLFVRDFGSVLMSVIHTMAGGEPVFRSTTDLSHASLWWPKDRLEVFPFHKMYRRLTDRTGESLVFFTDALMRKVGA
jgi:hypothetical protein